MNRTDKSERSQKTEDRSKLDDRKIRIILMHMQSLLKRDVSNQRFEKLKSKAIEEELTMDETREVGSWFCSKYLQFQPTGLPKNGWGLTGFLNNSEIKRQRIYLCENVLAIKLNDFADDHDDTLNETAIGIQLNSMRKFCPNFVYTYGAFSSPVLVTRIRPLDSYDPYKPYNHCVTELINGMSLSRYTSDHNLHEIMPYVLQVFFACKWAQLKYGFTHYDLHGGNVILRETSGPVVIDYPWGTVKSNHIAVIIDFGRSHARVKGKSVGRVIKRQGVHNYTSEFYDFYFILERLFFTNPTTKNPVRSIHPRVSSEPDIQALFEFFGIDHGDHLYDDMRLLIEKSYNWDAFVELLFTLDSTKTCLQRPKPELMSKVQVEESEVIDQSTDVVNLANEPPNMAEKRVSRQQGGTGVLGIHNQPTQTQQQTQAPKPPEIKANTIQGFLTLDTNKTTQPPPPKSLTDYFNSSNQKLLTSSGSIQQSVTNNIISNPGPTWSQIKASVKNGLSHAELYQNVRVDQARRERITALKEHISGSSGNVTFSSSMLESIGENQHDAFADKLEQLILQNPVNQWYNVVTIVEKHYLDRLDHWYSLMSGRVIEDRRKARAAAVAAAKEVSEKSEDSIVESSDESPKTKKKPTKKP